MHVYSLRFGDKWLTMKTGAHKEEDSLELEFSKATSVRSKIILFTKP